jgi:type I restriction enzyme S subunit
LLNVAIVNKEFEPEPIVSTAFAILNPYKDIYNKYLYYFLRSKIMIDYVESKMIGMAYPAINDTQFLKAPFPLPPLAEQKRIVAKVDQLMQLCDHLDACQKKAATKYESLNDAALEKLLSSKAIDEFANYWQFLCNNFDLIYNDPAHVNKLRQAILQLAVQGKLAPQDLNDEPASELLKRIKAEKEKLIAEGKIKKQKPLLPISEDEIPYELPQGWTWVRLGEIGLTQTGSTPPTSKREYYGNDYAFIKPADISGKGVRYEGGVGLSKKGIEKGRFVKAYSILMVCIGGSIGKVNFVDRDCSCNQQINAVTPYNDVDFCIVNYNLASPYFQNQVLTNAPSTTLPILSKGKWENIPFPLPPLAEQKRIVSKVDQLMQLCDELETRLNQSKKYSEMLMQAVLHEAFS